MGHHVTSRFLAALLVGASALPAWGHEPTAPDPRPVAAGSASAEAVAVRPEGPYARWRREGAGSAGGNEESEALAAESASSAPGTYRLGSGWDLKLGAQWRVRAMSERNRNHRGGSVNDNDFVLSRLLPWVEARHESGWRFYFEGVDARIGNEDLAPMAIDRNTADIRNLYVGYDQGDTHARVGRTDLKYGAQRLISPLDWGNTRRTFQGGVFSQGVDGGTVDVFATQPVNVRPRDADHSDDSRWFSGVYTTWDVAEGTVIDVYGLALNESTEGKAIAGDGSTGTFDIYTVGLRAAVEDQGFDAEVEAAHQFGQFAGDDVDASMFTARAGHTWENVEFSPRLGFDLDWASGDSDPTDDRKETFNQLFPLGHRWLGLADMIGRENVLALQGNLELQLDESTQLWLAYNDFSLDDRRDALYSPGGGVVLADPSGGAGTEVGGEWDLTVTHKMDDFLGFLDKVQVGYAYFTPGQFVTTLASNDRTTVAWLELTAEF